MKKVSVFSVFVGGVLLIAPFAFAQVYYPPTGYSVPPVSYSYAPAYTAPAASYPYSLYNQVSAAPATAVCTNLTQDLAVGSRNSSVTQLQAFLLTQNYPGAGQWMLTGYFGAATQASVRNFQQLHELPPTGVVDAATRAAIAGVSCGLPVQTGAYPVNYQTQYPYLYDNNAPYVYNNYNNGCANYGTYPVGAYPYYCGAAPTVSYLNPNAGGVGSSVTVFGQGFSPTNNTVHFGIAIITNLTSIDGRTLTFTVPGQLSGYGLQPITLGTYPVSVSNAAGQTSNALPFNVTSLSQYGQPSIGSINGPTSLNTGNSGVWTVQVYNPSSTYLTVTVNWGDQNAYPYAVSQSPQTLYSQGSQTLSFSHTYQSAGTYTITFTVTNNNGASNFATATVYVTGGGYNNNVGTPTITYLSPTSGPVNSTVTIYGTNFSQWGNTVRFGNGAITNVSSNGTSITFAVPTYLSPYCVSGMACPQYAQVVTPGSYPVAVINGSGNASNAVNFNVQ